MSQACIDVPNFPNPEFNQRKAALNPAHAVSCLTTLPCGLCATLQLTCPGRNPGSAYLMRICDNGSDRFLASVEILDVEQRAVTILQHQRAGLVALSLAPTVRRLAVVDGQNGHFTARRVLNLIEKLLGV